MLEDTEIILAHACSSVTKWGQSLERVTEKRGRYRDAVTPLSRMPCFTLRWLGLSQASIQGTRAHSISGTVTLWGREWIAATEENQFPNLLLLIFTWLGSCERALGETRYSSSPCGFLCVLIARAHVWAWRQRWQGSLPHSYTVASTAT